MTGLLLDAAGWAGAAALLFAYGLVSSGRLDGRSMRFQLLNLVGAAGLLVNGMWHGAWPSAALNAVWLVIGVSTIKGLRTTRMSAPGLVRLTSGRLATRAGDRPRSAKAAREIRSQSQ